MHGNSLYARRRTRDKRFFSRTLRIDRRKESRRFRNHIIIASRRFFSRFRSHRDLAARINRYLVRAVFFQRIRLLRRHLYHITGGVTIEPLPRIRYRTYAIRQQYPVDRNVRHKICVILGARLIRRRKFRSVQINSDHVLVVSPDHMYGRNLHRVIFGGARRLSPRQQGKQHKYRETNRKHRDRSRMQQVSFTHYPISLSLFLRRHAFLYGATSTSAPPARRDSSAAIAI